MPNWECRECGLTVMDEEAGEPEPCLRCGKKMVRVDGVIMKNFGGAGYRHRPDQK